jgi:phosphohistidine phosphatase
VAANLGAVILYLMRHGPADDRAPSGRDWDRSLSPEGRDVVRAVAESLSRMRGQPLERIVSSPAVRAHQTSAIVASIAGVPGLQIELRAELAPDEEPAFDLAIELSGSTTDVLMVGHQPTIEIVLRSLTTSNLIPPFSTALVVALSIDAATRESSLVGIVDPRDLERL